MGISTGIAKLDRKKFHRQPIFCTVYYTYDNMLRHMSAHKGLFLYFVTNAENGLRQGEHNTIKP